MRDAPYSLHSRRLCFTLNHLSWLPEASLQWVLPQLCQLGCKTQKPHIEWRFDVAWLEALDIRIRPQNNMHESD